MKPDKRNNNNPNRGGGSNNRRNAFGLVSIVLWALFLTLLFRGCMSSYENANTVTVPYTTFREWLVEDKIQAAVIDSSQITFTLKEGVEVELPQSEQSNTGSQTQELMQSLIPTRQQDPNEPVQYVTVRLANVLDDELMSLLTQYLSTEEGEYAYTEPADSSLYLLNLFLAYVLPVLIMVGLFWFLFRGVGGKGGIGGMGNLGKSNAKVYVEKKTGVTFLDVAGQDEAKESLQEIIPSGDHRHPAQPPEVHRDRCQAAQGRPAGGPAGHRQDPAGQGGGRRGRRPLLLHQRLRLRGDVRGHGRGPGPGSVQRGRQDGPLHHLHR